MRIADVEVIELRSTYEGRPTLVGLRGLNCEHFDGSFYCEEAVSLLLNGLPGSRPAGVEARQACCYFISPAHASIPLPPTAAHIKVHLAVDEEVEMTLYPDL